MSRLTGREWRLASAVIRLIAAEGSVTEAALADRLGASPAEVHHVVGMLVGRGKVDRASDYLVPVREVAGQ